ncbi:MAG: DUF3536 domain-containing protein, partial [Gemmatimonadota bacterium]|nr:DUF3536 domain-containing protein [Gemmatimonadota bacterium]
MRSIIIHGHYYQPPREDPWLEEVEAEPTARPYHDWNERIEQDCYRAVAAARIPGPTGRIARLVNLYEWTSFNFGPTLLEWLEEAAPDTYAAILSADRASATRLGHGNALAMPYHHLILPLCSRREKETEVRWGLLDFERRFGRPAGGMWLPETAVDEETLDVLSAAGVRFTVVAPHQVTSPPPAGLPGRVQTSSGRSIALFVYDGAVSHDVAFGPLVRDATAWLARLVARGAGSVPPELVTIATDGETYGHHHAFAEMALARVIESLRTDPGARLDNFGSFLERRGAHHEVTLLAPSSWSCTHGVERWRSDCGCRIAPERPWNQAWRTPLRRALAGLARACHAIFDREAAGLFRDPGQALADYGRAIGAGTAVARAYADDAARPGLDGQARIRARELLELERGALRSLTSCAWFHDDLGGIEVMQVLRYAAWVVARVGSEAPAIESTLLGELEQAVSNDPRVGTGRDIYLRLARPAGGREARLAAGLAAARLLAPEAASSEAWEIEGPDAALTLIDRRTGRRIAYSVAMESEDLGFRADVRAPDGSSGTHLGLGDLPERQRSAVAARLRRRALPHLLSPEELGQLDNGSGVQAVVRRALARQARALRPDATEGECRVLTQLLEILEQLGQTTPFEVQSLFYRVWQGEGQGNAGLTGLARR